jgi:hypothetical protein
MTQNPPLNPPPDDDSGSLPWAPPPRKPAVPSWNPPESGSPVGGSSPYSTSGAYPSTYPRIPEQRPQTGAAEYGAGQNTADTTGFDIWETGPIARIPAADFGLIVTEHTEPIPPVEHPVPVAPAPQVPATTPAPTPPSSQISIQDILAANRARRSDPGIAADIASLAATPERPTTRLNPGDSYVFKGLAAETRRILAETEPPKEPDTAPPDIFRAPAPDIPPPPLPPDTEALPPRLIAASVAPLEEASPDAAPSGASVFLDEPVSKPLTPAATPPTPPLPTPPLEIPTPPAPVMGGPTAQLTHPALEVRTPLSATPEPPPPTPPLPSVAVEDLAAPAQLVSEVSPDSDSGDLTQLADLIETQFPEPPAAPISRPAPRAQVDPVDALQPQSVHSVLADESMASMLPTWSGKPVTFWRVFASESRKLVTLRTPWILLIVAVVLAAAVAVVFSSGLFGNSAETVNLHATDLVTRGVALSQLIWCIFGVLMITCDYGSSMARATLLAVPGRARVYWSKWLLSGLLSFIVSTVAAFASMLLILLNLNGSLVDDTLTPQGLSVIAMIGLANLTACWFGLGIGALAHNSPGAIAVAVSAFLLIPELLHRLPWDPAHILEPWFLRTATERLYTMPDTATATWSTTLGQLTYLQAGLTTTLWVLIPLILGAATFKRRDIF